MSYGVFEAALGSEVEVGLAKQASVDKMAEAVYDVREKLGPILFASQDVEEFRHKVAMMKADQSVYKIIAAHTFPLPKVIRRIVGRNSVLENEFLQRQADLMGAPEPEAGTADIWGKPPSIPLGPGPQTPTSSGNRNPQGLQTPGASSPVVKLPTASRRQSVFDTIDHPKWDNGTVDTDETFEGGKTDKELKPKGNFSGYLNKVDQGAKGKVKRNFASLDFSLYTDWCAANGLSAGRLSSLDRYAANLPTATYFKLAEAIQAWESEHHPKVPNTKLKNTKVAGAHDADPDVALAYPGYRDTPGKAVPELAPKPRNFNYEETGDYRDLSEADMSPQKFLRKVPGEAGPGRHRAAREDKVAGAHDWNDIHPGDEYLTSGPVRGELKPDSWTGRPFMPRHEGEGDQPYAGTHRAARDPLRPYIAWCRKHGLKRLSARNINHYAQGDPQLAYFLAMRAKEAIRVARRRQGSEWADEESRQNGEEYQHKLRKQNPHFFRDAEPPLAIPVADDHDERHFNSPLRGARRRRGTEEPVVPGKPSGLQTPVVDVINSLGDPSEVTGPRHGRRRRASDELPSQGWDIRREPPARPRALQDSLGEMSREEFEAYRNRGRGEPVEPEYHRGARRRTAAPDYLQKADDALTQLLNQKAEEFQQTIAPLQQALITVQQAEQLQQQQNPLSVLPPPGTVNVMPGAADSTPGQLGMPDPNQPDISGLVQALQPGGGAMGGVAPQDQGGEGGAGAPPPAAAGGGALPPDLDQSAQRAARRGKARGAVRPRQAAGVGELWDAWKNNRTDQGDALRGDEVDYNRFQSEHGVGDRAMQNLRKRNQTPDFAPINGAGRGRSSQGVTVGSRRQACWPGCHENEAHAAKFHSKDKKKKAYRRRQAGPYDPGPEYDNVQYDDFHSPAPGSPQAECQHPGQARGWKGQFAQDQPGPYDGEFYTKGRARVRGGPGPEGNKYWLHTPHGMTGPHGSHDEAFDAAEPYLGQAAEIDKGQGELFAPPRARGAARQRRPLGRRKTAWTGWGPAVFPKTRKVAGWDWDDYQNGYLANSPRHFECSCGEQFPTPSGFQRCACGRQWNSYVIGNGGSNKEASADQFIVREIPVRPDVIVANRKMASFLGHTPDHKIPEYLEHLRGKVQGQNISTGELSDLQGLAGAGYIHPDDMELHEAAGTPEEDFRRGQDRDPDSDPFDPREFGANRKMAVSDVPGYNSSGARKLREVLDKHRGNRPVEAIEAWEDPDVHQDPFDPRLHGANRKGMRKGAPFAGYEDFDDCTSKNSDKDRPDAYCGEIKHRTEDKKAYRLVDRRGNIHTLIDPGELGEGDDPGHSTFRKQPKDWARRSGDGKWQGSAIG